KTPHSCNRLAMKDRPLAHALARRRRSHGTTGRASTRRLGAPQRRTHVLRQQRRHAMNTPIVRTRFVLVLVPLVLAIFGASSSAFACVVGTGKSATCTETALNDCLPGGVNFDGTVTFDCGGAVTIPVTTTKTINTDTTIDGGALNGVPQTTITGGGPAGLFFMIAPFTVKNLGLGIASGDGAI